VSFGLLGFPLDEEDEEDEVFFIFFLDEVFSPVQRPKAHQSLSNGPKLWVFGRDW